MKFTLWACAWLSQAHILRALPKCITQKMVGVLTGGRKMGNLKQGDMGKLIVREVNANLE